jgi:hypothetical protein
MSFPQYSVLAYPSSAVYVNSAGAGIRGLIVFNAGSGNFWLMMRLAQIKH